ncbi:diguanylate cyclase (GGDEF)-like protein [Bradyrhizobium sp. GM6.1]
MFNRVDLKGDLPDCIRVKLQEAAFTEPSSYGMFAVGLGLATPLLWSQTQDTWLLAFGVGATILSINRMIIGLLFARLNRQSGWPGLTTCWTVIFVTGSIFTLDIAALAIRAASLKEAISIELTAIIVAAYMIGLVTRAGAFPEVAVPHTLMLFIPLIAAALIAGTAVHFLIALILSYFLFAAVRIILVIHGRIKAQLLAEHRLSVLALTDHLTGLANRSGFEERALAALENSRSGQSHFVVALIDLDGFKAVNDTHGHGAGDDLLKQVGTRIVKVVGEKHLPGRLGGDEFVIMFDENTTIESAISLGSELVTALKLPYKIGAATLHISGSVGLACSENRADTFSAVLERADKALYRAKNGGKNQVQSLRTIVIEPACKADALRPTYVVA